MSCLQYVNEMLPVFIIFLYKHLSVAMLELSRLQRSWIRLQEVGHLSILTQDAYIQRCRLKLVDATLSIYEYWIVTEITVEYRIYYLKYLDNEKDLKQSFLVKYLQQRK